MKDYLKLQKLDRYLQIFRRSGVYNRPKTLLSDADIMVLFCIAFCGNERKVKLSDIAKKLHVTLPAITHKVNDLVVRGYIEKEISAKDLRVTHVKLTQSGLDFVNENKDSYYANIELLIQHLGVEDTNTLIKLLERVSFIGKIQ